MARKTVKTMAQKMAESGKEPAKDVLDDTGLSDDPIISALQSLRISIDDLQHNDDGYGADKLQSAVTANSNKTGISTSQASAITANTSKTGITTSQASAISANTSKTGTTSTERTRIAANHAKVSYDKNLSNTSEKAVVMTVTESRGTYALVFTMTHGRVTKTATIALR